MEVGKFLRYLDELEEIQRPTEFNYPFFYQSTPLAECAAQDLMQRIEQDDFNAHNFIAENANELSRGKMFGVLVVEDQEGKLAYLSAFSGKVGNSNHIEGFVPPVYDLLSADSFFTEEYAVVSDLIEQVNQLQKHPDYIALRKEYHALMDAKQVKVNFLKQKAKDNKLFRNAQRKEAEQVLTTEEYHHLEQELAQKSIADKLQLKHTQQAFSQQIEEIKAKIEIFEQKLKALQALRAEESKTLQRKIFEHYKFLNANQEQASLLDIFKDSQLDQPPAGAGECCAPKLLHFAYLNHLKPLAIVEFWWGDSPKSEIRKHKNYYPACQSKCKPILGHMLEGLKVQENPLIAIPSLDKEIEILYEEEEFLVINKPSGLLSVPGKVLKDSVQTRMEALYPDSKDHMIVHRLDMMTSGVMLVAKSKRAHKQLQSQFAKRKMQKRYIALLDGILKWQEGDIDLPLRVDLEDRPRQIVCFEHGKPAFTHYEIIERKKGKTKVYFYPKTGRTHQLRVHAAHASGLNIPIVGDDLYGTPDTRLHLHAERIELYHPITNERVVFTAPCEF
ncbi:tRNA pseudouridine32 synthase / 23S rRNA pseudouridine746 synthase [Lishizhenia tianjinensis]|uniref:tRNA pseudouridine32 synthase / 23S rRNA pseudouridine746 synthase n=1 Tax=Lishizhenia tianjinensis TaxID=477690 RepID=A0A1I6YN15_9FLAO|nr:RluA family pseudouridine synthase [Lishizhenia tianjinensis]SFT51784.1 tRNA pseudouridine32 synthase / 23S rRNA pseudouridine746 synthase [Lishizhenia tianjinensis]